MTRYFAFLQDAIKLLLVQCVKDDFALSTAVQIVVLLNEVRGNMSIIERWQSVMESAYLNRNTVGLNWKLRNTMDKSFPKEM